MRNRLLLTARCFLGIIVVLGLAGCRTLEYRQVQRDFQAAVQADNAGQPQPFGNGFELVITALTPERIDQLDPRLRPNAWMLRAVSAWRSGSYSNANTSAEQGLKAAATLPDAKLFTGSRDDVLLHMIPALVTDSEQTRRLDRTNASISAADYKSFERAYKTALAQMDDAAGQFNDNTPDDVRYYYYYERWRLLQHWTTAIGRIAPTDPDATINAFAQAKTAFGKPLEDAINEARDKIPPGQQFRALIRAQGGQ